MFFKAFTLLFSAGINLMLFNKLEIFIQLPRKRTVYSWSTTSKVGKEMFHKGKENSLGHDIISKNWKPRHWYAIHRYYFVQTEYISQEWKHILREQIHISRERNHISRERNHISRERNHILREWNFICSNEMYFIPLK